MVEELLKKQLLCNGVEGFNWKNIPGHHNFTPFLQASSLSIAEKTSCVSTRLPKLMNQRGGAVRTCAVRRRRLFARTETYVLLEPGQDEKFVSEEELKVKLKGYLENWPGKALPPDLAKFETTEDAVSFLVGTVCELEIDGDVGSVQWYEVRLE